MANRELFELRLLFDRRDSFVCQGYPVENPSTIGFEDNSSRCKFDVPVVIRLPDFSQIAHGRSLRDSRRTGSVGIIGSVPHLPAAAADADQNKRDVEKVASAYAESFGKQDAAGIAALYATGGMLVTPTGPHTEIAKYNEGGFKAGFSRNDITVNQVWSLGDNVLALGDYHLTGKNQGGTPIEEIGAWSSVYVREGGALKIHMLSAMPKPPPAAK